VGRRIFDLEELVGGRVAFVSRLGEGLIPTADTVHQDGDLVHFALDRARLAEAERILDAAPPAN
jgi:trk system potassium uptake protein TrkA